MAKEYYTLEEAADVLGVKPADLRQMVASGKLLEYEQDGATLFRIEDVERIVANEGSSIVDLTMSANEPDSGELSVPEPTSDINLLGLDESSIDLDLGPSPAISPQPPTKPAAKPAAKGAAPAADSGSLPLSDSSSIDLADSGSNLDLARLDDAARDIGLSASDVIALDEHAEKPADAKASTRITTPGMNVFDEPDAAADSDPLAKTRISAAPDDELAIAQVGSGSGLLDLTRESDDTSLGAELLDVISPSEGTETETAAEPVDSDTGTIEAEVVETVSDSSYAAEEAAGSTAGESDAAAVPVGAVAAAVPAYAGGGYYVEDPLSPAFTGLAVVAMVALTIVGVAATSQIQGVWPGFMRLIDSGTNLYLFAGGIVLLAGIAFGVGFAIGKPSTGAAKPKKQKPAKPAPAKKDKKKK